MKDIAQNPNLPDSITRISITKNNETFVAAELDSQKAEEWIKQGIKEKWWGEEGTFTVQTKDVTVSILNAETRKTELKTKIKSFDKTQIKTLPDALSLLSDIMEFLKLKF